MLLVDKLKMLNNWRNTIDAIIDAILYIYFCYRDFKCNVKITYKLIKNYMKK